MWAARLPRAGCAGLQIETLYLAVLKFSPSKSCTDNHFGLHTVPAKLLAEITGIIRFNSTQGLADDYSR